MYIRGLGLAPPNRTSGSYFGLKYGTSSHPNFLYELMSSGVLAHKVMTLSLPRDVEATGKLVFGREPPPYKHRIPLSQKPAPQPGGAWNVDLSSISFSGPGQPLNISLDLSAAIALRSNFVAALTWEIIQVIYEYLGAKEGGYIDCDSRRALPNLTLVLGGQTITLGWEDYTRELDFDTERICWVLFRYYPLEDNRPLLGLSILQKFDATFDMERNEIGRKLNS